MWQSSTQVKQGIPQVKTVIAVASGKGGVGKSTVSVNLALALTELGLRVGLLDADIYGPSTPMMMGVTEQPEVKDQRLTPLTKYGVQTMSIGYLVETNAAMIWRGPMVSSALQQLMRDTEWDNLDYLIVDLPPGTGDIQLTLTQKMPLDGALVVTTPQEIALLDARRAVAMFNKVRVPVLGVIENMSQAACSHCGHVEHLFGSGGGEKLAAECEVSLLGSIPLDRQLRENMDKGTPTVIADRASSITQEYLAIAKKVHEKMQSVKATAKKFPKIVIQS